MRDVWKQFQSISCARKPYASHQNFYSMCDRKKLTELPPTAYWSFVRICIIENPQKIYKPRLIMGKYRE